MGKLTEKQSAGYDLKALNGEWCNHYCHKQRVETCNECGIYQAIQKLAEYEDAEEQGKLVILPCKVGQIVYRVCKKKYDVDGYGMQWEEDWGIVTNSFHLGMLNEIGKNVFLTREEAEEILKSK